MCELMKYVRSCSLANVRRCIRAAFTPSDLNQTLFADFISSLTSLEAYQGHFGTFIHFLFWFFLQKRHQNQS